MSDEIEYIEPTQEHVGQIVEVRDSDNRDMGGVGLVLRWMRSEKISLVILVTVFSFSVFNFSEVSNDGT